MKLKASVPVNTNYQILFVVLSYFLIPLHVWGYYRIGKLRRYFQLVCVPMLFIILFGFIPPNPAECESDWWLFFIYDTCESFEYNLAYAIIESGFMIYSIYLVRKWSIQWNESHP